jgi:hypothetical protein
MMWHWIITMQWVTGRGETAICTASGTVPSPQVIRFGTRNAAYEAIVDFVEPPAGVSPGTRPMVLFFSLEPDDLAAAAAGTESGQQ